MAVLATIFTSFVIKIDSKEYPTTLTQPAYVDDFYGFPLPFRVQEWQPSCNAYPSESGGSGKCILGEQKFSFKAGEQLKNILLDFAIYFLISYVAIMFIRKIISVKKNINTSSKPPGDFKKI